MIKLVWLFCVLHFRAAVGVVVPFFRAAVEKKKKNWCLKHFFQCPILGQLLEMLLATTVHDLFAVSTVPDCAAASVPDMKTKW